MKLEGSKILLTGASSGIGAALAPILAERGATVGIVARRANRLEEVLELCKKHTPESRMWAVDLSDLDAAEQLALDAWDAFGGLDAIVHNAAIPKRVHMSRLTVGRRRRDDERQLRLAGAHDARGAAEDARAEVGHDRVGVEHGRPHPDRQRVGLQRGEVRDVPASRRRCTSTSRAAAST